MRSVRQIRGFSRAVVLALAIVFVFVSCARRSKSAKHASEPTAMPAPTPDNTPIPVLRTPAGLVLKLEEAGPATPPPPTTPAAARSANPTP